MSPELSIYAALAVVVFAVLSVCYTIFVPDKFVRGKDSSAELVWGVLMLTVVFLLWFFAGEGRVAALQTTFATAKPYMTASAFGAYFGGYAVIGLVWAVTYFWLYARRLGVRYVMERDNWLRANRLDKLDEITSAQRESFTTGVLGNVKREMLYDGDFPLKPLQQKRFFGVNLMLWPVTAFWYLAGDLAMDVAQRCWFVLRGWIHSKWAAAMSEYLADDALCVRLIAEANGKAVSLGKAK